jgi:hypothetical protein
MREINPTIDYYSNNWTLCPLSTKRLFSSQWEKLMDVELQLMSVKLHRLIHLVAKKINLPSVTNNDSFLST